MKSSEGQSRFVKAGRFAVRYGYAAACSAYAFTLGLPRHRMLIYDICARFGWAAPNWLDHVPELLPSVPPSQVVGFDAAIHVDPDRVSGNTSLLESVIINKLVKQSAPQNIFELGTFDGRTTLGIAANAPAGARILTLDLPENRLADTRFEVCENDKQYIKKPRSGEKFRGTPYEGLITQLYGDSATFDFTPYHGKMDFVFVDASHAYEYVLNDSDVALALLSPAGGLVLWHDYGGWDGVTRALNDRFVSDPRFAALRHVDGTSIAMLVVGDRAATPPMRGGGQSEGTKS